ncbi:unnamed protein product [Schistosoma spindalis]|nr:unnamed protein product [Schistosoma spindale]
MSRTFFRPVGSAVLPLIMSSVMSVERGTSHSLSYRMFLTHGGSPISCFHDVPLLTDTNIYYNMIVEIPRWTNAKMEICKEELMNPIKQDVKNNKLRYVNNVFPHKGYIWNYGALPQTWEDPNHVDENTKAKGDNDPIDVCEIGSKIWPSGSIIPVKVLGILAMVDEGEADWKVIVINAADPMADKLNDIHDVDTHMPGLLKATRDWFKYYKVPTGKPENTFAFNGEFKNKEFASKIISQTHEQWQKLISTKVEAGSIIRANVTVKGSPYMVSKEDFLDALQKHDAFTHGSEPTDQAIDQWHFCNPNV